MSGQATPGYKLTDVGVVPENWEIVALGNLSEFITSGSRGWARYYSSNGALFIRSQNVRDGRLDLKDRQFVSPPKGSEGSRTRVKLHDLLITITGNNVGNVALVEQELGETYISQHVGLVRLREPLSGQYVCRFLSPGSLGNMQISGSQSGQSKPGLTLKNLHSFWVALPPPSERRAIAAALSDMDSLISGLDQLIAKKRDIKQAAMQQLFTGQQRVSGFSGEWEVKPMRALGCTYGGLAGKTKSNFGHGDARYIPFMNVMTDTVIDPSWLEPVDVAPDEVQNLAKKGDLFFNGSSETPEEVGFCSVLLEDIPNLYLNSFCFGFRFNSSAKVNGLFFAYWFRSKPGRTAMSVLAQGATRYNIAKSAFMQLEIPQPSEEEQTAIASILSDMDGELATLKARCDKARQIKLGMMQELLTGRIRLK